MTKARDLTTITQQTVSAEYSSSRDKAGVYSEFQLQVLGGFQPYTARVTTKSNAKIKSLSTILPEGDWTVVRTHFAGTQGKNESSLVMDDMGRHSLLIERSSNWVEMTVASTNSEDALRLLKEMFDKVPKAEVADHIVDTWIWNLTAEGPKSTLKKLTAQHWDEINANYIPKVHDELAKMMQLERPQHSGKIILWHGPPGTGKTTALRTLARSWKSWCEFHYISDPEKFFAEPSYLMEVGTTTDTEEVDDDDPVEDGESGKELKTKWRLVVAEDSDAFLRRGARESAGASLGRLLNFSDGILGQGSNTLILLTTNTEIDKLDAAITRPGRCLAQVHFDKFSTEQGYKWNCMQDIYERPASNMTLAELIEAKNNRTSDRTAQIVAEREYETVGQYL